MEPMHYIASRRLITEIDIDLVSSPSDNNHADLTQPNDSVQPHRIPCEH